MTTADTEKGKYESPDGSKAWEYMATFACSILMFCIGSSIGWNSPSSVKLESEESPIRLDSAEISTLLSLIAVGQMIAPPLNSLIVDRIGRKNTLLLVGLPLIISWSLVTVADNVMILYLARAAAGLSQGVGYCVSYMYVGEIASSTSRGVANVLMIVMLNLGMLMAFAVGPPLTIYENAWLNLVLASLFVGVFWLMPESPYYLLMSGQSDEAEEVLQKLRGRTDVSEELESIERSLRSIRKLQESSGASREEAGSLRSLFSDPASLKAILIIGLFSLTHHFGGYMTVLTYGQKIFRELKIKLVSDYTANVVNGAVQLVSVALTTLFVDRWGRKPLIAFSGVLSGLCCLLVAIYFHLLQYSPAFTLTATAVATTATNATIATIATTATTTTTTELPVSYSEYYSLIPMIAVFMIVFAFNCGLIIVQGILISELFAPEFKALGVCVVIMNGGLMYTVSTKLYATVAETWHYGHSPPFFFFVIVVWVATAVLMYITPETKGKTLLEIQKALINKK